VNDIRSTFYLSNIRVAVGEIVQLNDLSDQDVVANRDALRDGDMTCAAVLDEPSVTQAAELLRKTEEPGCIIYATEEFESPTPSELIDTLLCLSGHQHTPASIVSGNGCGNIGAAVALAAGLSGESGAVTVVTSDRARPGKRVMSANMTLLGDAAGICTVTTQIPDGPGFELVALQSTMRAPGPGPTTNTTALRAMIDGVGEATRGALDAAGWKTDDVAGMVVGEYSTGARRFLAHASGIPRQLTPRLRAGHCHSTDLLRGLVDLVDQQYLPDGAPLLALASGGTSWTTLALRYHAG
jgi:3-oxoacyl-[acyl-carrier-protein] synthase III